SSPALSVSSRTGTAAFTVYENGKYDIYVLDEAGRAREPQTSGALGTPKIGTVAASGGGSGPNASALPPIDRRGSEVQGLLANATLGLPPSTNYETTNYKPSLSLEAVAQPSIAVGASRFGAAVGGGVA